jgi:small multidrug resistance pump
MNPYLLLAIGIVTEVIATTALKASDGCTRPLPTGIMIVGYTIAFYSLSLTLRTIPVGVTYALWSGVGIVLITAIGWTFFRQSLDAPAIIGIGLIVVGVLVVNLFSKAMPH